MILGRVTGTVVATVKIPELAGSKLLVIHPVNPDGSLSGKPLVAVDPLQAGIGDEVLVIDEGGSAGIMLGMSSRPVRTVVAAIVDRVEPAAGKGDRNVR